MILQIAVIVAVVIILCFGFVVAFGAPYLPTLRPQVAQALTMLDLRPGQTLLELGCGDGQVLVAAARQDIRVIGYELNPLLYIVCVLRTWRYRRLVRVRLGDFWRADWPPADAVFGFILPRLMSKLDAKIITEKRTPLKVVSFAFPIPGRQASAEKHGVYLYEYSEHLSEAL